MIQTAYNILARIAYPLRVTRPPRRLLIETTTACNCRCTICPRGTRLDRRPAQHMDMQLFERIMHDLEHERHDEYITPPFRRKCPESIHIGRFGEPLMDPFINERLERAAQVSRYLGAELAMTTNGALLGSHLHLLDYIARLEVSFEGYSKDAFERVRPGLHVQDVIDGICAAYRKLGDRLYIAVTRIDDCMHLYWQLYDNLRSVGIRHDHIILNRMHNWQGTVPAPGRRRLSCVCCNPWRQMVIAVDGTVSGCCIDYNNRLSISKYDGTRSLWDIWTGPEYRAFRAAQHGRKPQPCRECNWCDRGPWLKAGKDAAIRMMGR